MNLIADSGSTKTDWCLMDNNVQKRVVETQGINPFYQSDEEIVHILNCELLPLLDSGSDKVGRLYFYGAGLRPEMQPRINAVMSSVFKKASVEAESDLLGAARALFGHERGIACILGTGSNSGLYDGHVIVKNTPPMGYILGDEGSGATLGKLFAGSLCKGLLSDALLQEYLQYSGQTVADIIQRVYRTPLPNRYLAGMAPFIHEHLNLPQVHELVVDNFRMFFRKNLVQYGDGETLKVRAIGSIAYYFRKQLGEAAQLEHFSVDLVERSPMNGLVAYHQKENA